MLLLPCLTCASLSRVGLAPSMLDAKLPPKLLGTHRYTIQELPHGQIQRLRLCFATMQARPPVHLLHMRHAWRIPLSAALLLLPKQRPWHALW